MLLNDSEWDSSEWWIDGRIKNECENGRNISPFAYGTPPGDLVKLIRKPSLSLPKVSVRSIHLDCSSLKFYSFFFPFLPSPCVLQSGERGNNSSSESDFGAVHTVSIITHTQWWWWIIISFDIGGRAHRIQICRTDAQIPECYVKQCNFIYG